MPRTAFLFPGQGAQTVGMAKALCETVPAALDLFRRASAILGYDLLRLCADGPAEALNATNISQPAIFVASLAALESLRASEPGLIDDCECTAGLSLGEYTALVFAEAITFEDGLRVVKVRGEAMQAASEATPSAMTSVLTLDQPVVDEIVREASSLGRIRLANYLCPGNLVLSGEVAAIVKAEELAAAKGGMAKRLSVSGAFHTDIMKPADDKLAAALDAVTLSVARIPVWSNTDAFPHTLPDEIRPLLVEQVVQSVLWEATMRRMLESGIERFVEVGPGRVLAGLMKRINRKADFRNITA